MTEVSESNDLVVDPLPKESPSRRPYQPLFPTFHKAAARIVSFAGQRNLSAAFSPVVASYGTVTDYDVEVYPGVAGLVALTIDDTPCRQGPSACMVQQVRELLSEFDATATFMTTAEFVNGHEEDMIKILMDGHDIANHGFYEAPAINLEEEEFEKQLLKSEAICEDLRQRARECKRQRDAENPEVDVPQVVVEPGREPERAREGAGEVADEKIRWFRAPGGIMTPTMVRVLERQGYTHALGDCYANDPVVTDAQFIADTMLENCMDGSVMIIHMPERGFREYNLPALRLVLQGLQDRDLKAVTLNALHVASMREAVSEVVVSPMYASVLPDIVQSNGTREHLYRSSNIFKGTFNAAVSVSKGVLTGAAGVFVKPYEGACKDGVAGFASGLGEGLVGAVSNSVDGVLEGGTQIVGGVAGTVRGVPRAFANCVKT